ncbi:MAG: HEAT repeat domain-containing protein [Phycisphaerae bacterium]
MKHRSRWLTFLTAAAVAVLAVWAWRYTSTPQWRAARLVAELRRSGEPSGWVARALAAFGFRSQRRNPEDIAKEAAALGPIAVGPLTDALGDRRWRARYHAAQALYWMGPRAEQAVPALVEALCDDHHYVRSWAASALGNFGPAARAAIPELIRLVRDDPAEDVRRPAAMTLAQIGPEAAGAVDVLIPHLKSSDRGTRIYTAIALGMFGPAARQAIPALTEAMRDPDEDLHREAAEALRRIRSSKAAGDP